MQRLAEAIVDVLESHDVDTVFGIPGNHNVELYRYLPDSPIRHVTARHEQGVGFMADGYARVTGKPGVCFVISGPGLTNLSTAMGQALADSIPMVVIATVGDQTQRQGRLHELPDQLSIARGVSVEAVQPADPKSAIIWLHDALKAHLHSRPGPRYLQIPLSWWQQEVVPVSQLDASAYAADAEFDVDAGASLLEEAARPVLVVGGGAKQAGTQVQQLAELLGSPIINTVNAKGIVPPQHPLWVGGSPSLPAVRQVLAQADVVVAVGTELGETDFDLLMIGDIEWTSPVLRIDIDAQASCLNVSPTVALVGDAGKVLDALCEALPEDKREGWCNLASVARAKVEYKHMHTDFDALFRSIDSVLPNAVVVGDSTRPTYYAAWMWERHSPATYFHSVSGYGTLGYALPAAIGAQIGKPNVPVVAIIGDGGVLFTLGELAVAVEYAVPIKVLLWDNSGYQEIAHSMAARGIDITSTQYGRTDFAQIASGFGAVVSTPKNLPELASALAQKTAGPHVLVLNETDFVKQPSGAWY
jgi:acetolactate synthase-1/2/3 large subunit